jgi:hypothetical protein
MEASDPFKRMMESLGNVLEDPTRKYESDKVLEVVSRQIGGVGDFFLFVFFANNKRTKCWKCWKSSFRILEF